MVGAATNPRWRILRDFILKSKKDQQTTDEASVRRIKSLGLVRSEVISKQGVWETTKFSIRCSQNEWDDMPTTLCVRGEGMVSLSDFTVENSNGVDNTGNVCLWPSEERNTPAQALSYVIHKAQVTAAKTDSSMQETSVSSTGDGAEAFVKGEVARPSLELFDFRGKRVLEIGAGQGVAGFLAALGAGTTSERKGSQVDLRAKSIVITDGNSQVVRTLKENVDAVQGQGPMQYTTELHAEELKWDEGLTTEVIRSLPGANKDPNQPPFDVVLAADCLFFKDFHKALVHTLSQALSCSSVLSSEKAAKPGYVIFINPPRGKTAQLFIEEAQEVLEFSTFAKGQFPKVDELEVDDAIQKTKEENESLFEDDIHWPILMVGRPKIATV